MRTLLVPLAVAALLCEGGEASAQTPEHTPRWTFSLGAREVYQTATEQPGQQLEEGGDFVTHLNASLGHRFIRRRGGFQLGLNGGAHLNHTVGELKHFTWGVAASGSRSLSRKGTIEAQVGSTLSYARDVSGFIESAGVPPYAVTRSDRAGVALHHRLPWAWEGRFEARGQRYVFDSPELVDGSTVGVEADLDRGLGPRVRIGASTGYRRTTSYGQGVEIGDLSGNLGLSVSRDVTLNLSGGLSRYRLRDEDEVNVSPTAAVGGTGHFGPHTLSAGLAQRVEQVYGLGTIGVARTASVGYVFSLGTRLDLTASAHQTRISESVVGQGPDRVRRFSTGLRYDITRHLTADAHYTYWTRGVGLDEWRTHSVSVALHTRFAWR